MCSPVLGRTDSIGATAAERPLPPKDILSVLDHMIGSDMHWTLPDRLNHPTPLTHDGKVVPL